MIISIPTITCEGKRVYISSTIHQSDRASKPPLTVWFGFPEVYKECISNSSDGFVVSLLILAMSKGEDIYLKGQMSLELFRRMAKYQEVFNEWFPKELKVINIQCNNFKDISDAHLKNPACAFSGGVDSFFTLWSHLPENEKNEKRRISYALFVHGFDIPLCDTRTFNTVKEKYEMQLKKIGIHLIPAATNIRDITRQLNWEFTHGSALIGTALFLKKIFSCFYIPSSDPYSDLVPWGSHPDTDPILSTREMEIVHDGGDFSRIQKIFSISNWEVTFSTLRVCWEHPDGLKNCCKCEKCIRTMLGLKMANSLENYDTFPEKLKGKYIRKCRTPHTPEFNQLLELRRLASIRKKKTLLRNLGITIFKNKLWRIIGKANPLKRKRIVSGFKFIY